MKKEKKEQQPEDLKAYIESYTSDKYDPARGLTDEQYIAVVEELERKESLAHKIEFLCSLNIDHDCIFYPGTRTINGKEYVLGLQIHDMHTANRAGDILVNKLKHDWQETIERELLERVESMLTKERKREVLEEELKEIQTKITIGSDEDHKRHKENKYYALGYINEKRGKEYEFIKLAPAWFDKLPSGELTYGIALVTAMGAIGYYLEKYINQLLEDLEAGRPLTGSKEYYHRLSQLEGGGGILWENMPMGIIAGRGAIAEMPKEEEHQAPPEEEPEEPIDGRDIPVISKGQHRVVLLKRLGIIDILYKLPLKKKAQQSYFIASLLGITDKAGIDSIRKALSKISLSPKQNGSIETSAALNKIDAELIKIGLSLEKIEEALKSK